MQEGELSIMCSKSGRKGYWPDHVGCNGHEWRPGELRSKSQQAEHHENLANMHKRI